MTNFLDFFVTMVFAFFSSIYLEFLLGATEWLTQPPKSPKVIESGEPNRELHTCLSVIG